jgi:hypothetical protein
LYNAKWDGIKTYLFSSGLAKVLEYVSITLGTHVDTDYAWFKAVGTKLFTQCISQSIVPNVSMAVKWPIEVIKQNLLKNRCLTQKLLNKLYEVHFPRVCLCDLALMLELGTGASCC